MRLARALAEGLESRGFSVTMRHDGQSGYQQAKEGEADVIVLDLMLPVLSGAEVCARLRAEGVRTPILVLTARAVERASWSSCRSPRWIRTQARAPRGSVDRGALSL